LEWIRKRLNKAIQRANCSKKVLVKGF